jgi:hypothetical protein
LEEKNHLNKVVAFLNQYLNDNYGFQSIKKTVKLDKVKNKGEYDDLEKIIETDAIKLINKVYIEWHSYMFTDPEKYKSRENKTQLYNISESTFLISFEF